MDNDKQPDITPKIKPRKQLRTVALQSHTVRDTARLPHRVRGGVRTRAPGGPR